MLKFKGLRFFLVVSLIWIVPTTVARASCDGFVEDVGQSFGISIKKDEATGKIIGFYMMGEASFLTPKASLVRKAKKKAFMSAKAEFSRFMKENFNAADLTSDLTNQIENTDQDGNTSGSVEEISSMVETMASNTEAVLSGIVPLGECVDTQQKLVMVLAGWKPTLSGAAADAKLAIKNDVARGDRPASASEAFNNPKRSSSDVKNDKGDSKKIAGLSITSIEVVGEGGDLKQATNEAIRSALAQVRGEKFASSQKNTDFTVTAEVSVPVIGSTGVAVETSTQYEVQSSEVRGIVSGYRYLSKTEISGGIKVTLLVEIPEYKSSIDASKNTIVVFDPILTKVFGVSESNIGVISSEIRTQIENTINDSGDFEVLDRQYLSQRKSELMTLSAGNNSISELARIGNLAGADFMLILEFSDLNIEVEEKKVGDKTFKRKIFNGSANLKLIEVASTNIVSSGKIPVRNMKFKDREAFAKFGDKVAKSVYRKVIKSLGTGKGTRISRDTRPDNDVKAATDRADERLKKSKERVKDDW